MTKYIKNGEFWHFSQNLDMRIASIPPDWKDIRNAAMNELSEIARLTNYERKG